MKKIISGVISIIMLIGCNITNNLTSANINIIHAEDVSSYNVTCIDNFTFYEYENHAVLVSCDKAASGKLIIPESVNNKPVTIIEADSFKSCTGFSNVVIPDTVTRINKSAFYGCNMTFLTIGTSVEIIEDGAFASCKSLSEIIIPDNVKVLGSIEVSDNSGCGVFAECTSAKTISIGDGVEIVGDNCFNNCTYTTSWTIGQNITKIGRGAFNNCTQLTTFKFPENVEYVGESAFNCCTSLYSVTLNNKLTSLPNRIFNYCKITSLSIPKNVTEIKGNILSYYNSGNTKPSINVTIYNPDCSIPANSSVFSSYDVSKITIHGYQNSTADVYASRYGFSFTPLPGSNILTETDYEFRYDKTVKNEIQITDITVYKEIDELQLPSYIDELPVTSITLNDLKGINTLKFADNMEKHSLRITNCSFNDIVINKNLIDISIYNCPGIKELNLANMYTHLSDNNYVINRITIYNLEKLDTLILPKDITSFNDSNRISNCSSLKYIEWPDKLEFFDISSILDINSEIELFLPNTINEICGLDELRTESTNIVTIVIPKNAYISSEMFGSTYSKRIDIFRSVDNSLDGNKFIIKYYKNSLASYYFNHISTGFLEYCSSYLVAIDDVDSHSNNIIENNSTEEKLDKGTINGDINGDNIIDGRDATILLTYYAKTSVGYIGTLEEFISSLSN